LPGQLHVLATPRNREIFLQPLLAFSIYSATKFNVQLTYPPAQLWVLRSPNTELVEAFDWILLMYGYKKLLIFLR